MCKSETEPAPNRLLLTIRKARRGWHFKLIQIAGQKPLSQGWVDAGDPEAVRKLIRAYIDVRFPKTKPGFDEEMMK